MNTKNKVPGGAATTRGLVRTALAAVGAATGNLLIWLVARAAGASMLVDAGNYSEVGAGLTVGASFVPLVVAGAVTWLLAARWPRVRGIARWAGVTLALVSCVSPFLAASGGTSWALAAMHVVGALAWYLVTAPTSKRR
ncbi:hypothetical protein CFRA_04125 [Corynebacterium frankenforstense DSM 45800]|uniref:Uncharacterized protein n=1 Tax=Corynebacterium frankenforstense DSM 45800 TaxID=1437875 RepID=A0A1L7CRY7_9CORY|nr:DUF6069 family protein [Corynebacterium frankenforstense]APT88588.1 hypothetical protein CFRA_04125 [Corynebacterium frankenforstense DSM 45800]